MPTDYVDESKSTLTLENPDLLPERSQDVAKKDAIRKACEQANLQELVLLADSAGGLLDDDLRKMAWPILLGCVNGGSKSSKALPNWRDLPPHKDEEQVQKDVDRAFVYYPSGQSRKDMDSKKAKLFDLIVCTLRIHPMLCYFQGYHDIVQVLLLVLGEDRAIEPISRLSFIRIRDYMLPSLSPALKHLELLPVILGAVDPELAKHLSLTRPIFALASTLTLYAHEIQGYSDIARLYDFILAHEPVFSIYLFAAIIISRRSEVLSIPIDEADILHVTLSKLPQPLNLEVFIERTLVLFRDHPPETLPGLFWWRISSLSVLKTSRDIGKSQRIEDAEILFRKQSQQLAREESLRKNMRMLLRNKKPIASITTALLVGVFSIYLRRSGNDRILFSVFWRAWNSIKAGQ